MAKKYYKTDNPEVLSAYEQMQTDSKKLSEDSQAFAVQFNAKNMMSTQMTGRRFGGLVLNDYHADIFNESAPVREDKHLWTSPNNNQISRPRSSLDVKKFKTELLSKGVTDQDVVKTKVKEAKAELETLQEEYRKGVSKLEDVSFDPFFETLGTNWGNLMFSGLKWFKHDGFMYFETGENFGDRMTEILGSEFETAEEAAE